MDYYKKYKKYKNKYSKYKKEMDIGHNFIFLHMTKNLKNLKNILNDGYIKLGSEIPKEDKYLSGYEDESYIFSNIYFKDLDNLEWFNDLSLIIKPEIINEQYVMMIGGWGNSEICIINPSDSKENKIQKLEKMKKYILDPNDLPSILLSSPKYMQHEVRFTSPIDIKKYLEGIVIGYENENEKEEKLKKVKELLLEFNLEKVKIYSQDKKILLE
jgi:hypothetical protein